MERKNFIDSLNFYKGLTIIYSVGLAGHIIMPAREYMFMLTPFVLLLSGLIVISGPIMDKDWKVLTWIFISAIITFAIEAIGVATGKIFGPYYYEQVLGIKFFEVPAIISFNWIIVIYGAVNCSKFLLKNKFAAWLVSSLLPVLFDFILEPVAIKFNYWQWETKTIPLQNYIAWFFISFLLTGFYHFIILEEKKKLPAFYFILLLIYFLILRIFA